MKKILIVFLLLFIGVYSFGQTPPKIVQRSTPSTIPQDARLSAQFNFYAPRYADTTEANQPTNLGADSSGALIYTYDIKNYWVRVASPKRWIKVGSSRFGYPGEDNSLTSNRTVAMNGYGLYLNTGKLSVSATVNTTDSAFVVFNGSAAMIKVSTTPSLAGSGSVNIRNLVSGNFLTSASANASVFLGSYVNYQGGAYSLAFQQDFEFLNSYPQLSYGNGFTGGEGFRLRNDTLAGISFPFPDSTGANAYKPFNIYWQNHNGYESKKFFINANGQVWGPNAPYSASLPDTLLGLVDGYYTKFLASAIPGGGGGGSGISGVFTQYGLVKNNDSTLSFSGTLRDSIIALSPPVGRTISINGTTQDLSTNRTYTITTSGTSNRISVTNGATNPTIDIAATYIGQTSITTLGTVTTGTLSAGAIVGGVTMTLGSDASYDLYYRNASGVLTRLANGTTGQFLGANTGAAPSWQTPGGGGGGGVTSVGSGWGLTGGPITASGTLVVDTSGSGVRTAANSYNKIYVDTAKTGYMQYTGTIYSRSMWDDLDSLTNIGVSTFTVSGGKILVSGGANNFANALVVSTTDIGTNGNTNLRFWKGYIRAKITATGNGMGIGVQSNTINGKYNLNVRLVTSSGQLLVEGGNNSGQTFATSATNLTLSVNDDIEMSIERRAYGLIAWVRNVTTNSQPVEVAYNYNIPTDIMQNNGRFAIFAIGSADTYTVDSIAFSSNELYQADLCVLGDSKADYSATTGFAFSELLRTNFKVYVSAGGFETSAEWESRLGEIISRRPRSVLILNPSNDARTGVNVDSTKARVYRIETALRAAGIQVYFSDGFYEASVNPTLYAAWIDGRCSPDSVIYTFAPTNGNAAFLVSGESPGVHPGTYGHSIIYNLIMASNKIRGASQLFPSLSVLANYVVLNPPAAQSGTISLTSSTPFRFNGYMDVGTGTAAVSSATAGMRIRTQSGENLWLYGNSGNNYVYAVDANLSVFKPIELGGSTAKIKVGSSGSVTAADFATNGDVLFAGDVVFGNTSSSGTVVMKATGGSNQTLQYAYDGSNNTFWAVNNARNAGAGFDIRGATLNLGLFTSGGASIDVFNISSTGATVWNEGGAAINLRFESDTDANLFVTDGTNNKISIGTATASAKVGILSTTEQLRLQYDASNYSAFTVASTGSTTIDLIGTTPVLTIADSLMLPLVAQTGNDTTSWKIAVIDNSGHVKKMNWVFAGGGGGGSGTVTDFIFTDGSGFDGTVATSTSTPTLSLTTTVSNTQIMYSNSGAIVGDADFLFNGTQLALGASLSTNIGFVFSPTVGGASSFGIYGRPVMTPGSGGTVTGYDLGGSATEFSAGNHSLIATVIVTPLTITGGTATVSSTANLYVGGPISATVTGTNWALYVSSGPTYFGGVIRQVTNTTTSSSTPTPDANATNIYTVTALAANATFGAPTGSPTDGQTLIIRILDNGSARTLAWNAIYREGSISLPVTTVVSETMYLQFIYNAQASTWDFLGYTDQFNSLWENILYAIIFGALATGVERRIKRKRKYSIAA